MKAARFIIPAMIVFFSACQKEPGITVIVTPVEEDVVTETMYSISILASKGAGGTKALDLVSGTPDHLDAYWKDSEQVKVYKGGTLLGTLNVTPDAGEKPAKATLSGSIETAGLAANDVLTLMIPREDWDYNGQDGTLASIESAFDYATAAVTVTAVDDVNHTISTDGTASFLNQQSIYRFGFKAEENYMDPKSFTVSAAGGKLVQNISWSGSAWTPAYGILTVAPASASGDHFYYVSMRNESTSDDTYSFVITGSDDALYLASKAIPNTVLDTPGKFISAKNISASKPDFSPAGGTTETAL